MLNKSLIFLQEEGLLTEEVQVECVAGEVEEEVTLAREETEVVVVVACL